MKFLKNILGKQDDAAAIPIDAENVVLTPENTKSKEIIDIDLPGVRLFEIGDELHDTHTRFTPKHLGGLISAAGGILTLGISVKKYEDFTYKQGEPIAIIYSADKESYLITANVISMRKANKQDQRKLEPLINDHEYKSHLKEFFNFDTTSEFIIADILITREPRRHQFRKHVGVSVDWDVHFSLFNPGNGSASIQEKQLDAHVSQVVETKDHQFKIKTVDVSENGFKIPVKEMIPKGTQIECDVEITEKNIKTGKIAGVVTDCAPNKTNSEHFDLKVQFTDIPDSAKEILLHNIEEHMPPPVDAEVALTVSDDKMEASIKIVPPKHEGNDFSHEMFKEFLMQNGVVFGIDDTVLTSLAHHPLYRRDIVVARGLPATNGKDADFIYHVDTEEAFNPKELEDGTIDYKNLGLQQEVKEGALLCQKKPATKGRNGSDVMGNDVLPVPGTDKPMPAGTNTVLSEDGFMLYAAMDGNSSFAHNKINISNTYVVKGDVSLATGDIKYLGSVVIQGDVTGGFSVEATDDVTVNGSVGSAHIKTGGNLLIRGGFNGGKDGNLSVAGDAKINFIEGGTITVKGNLESTYLLDATVNCGSEVHVTGGKGLIRGGHVKALASITANFFGNAHSSVLTVVEVGNAPFLEEYYEDVCSKLESYDKEIQELGQTIQALSILRDTDRISPKSRGELKEAEERIEEVRVSSADLRVERDALSEKMKNVGYGSIIAKKTAYDNAKIVIGPESLSLNSAYSFAKFTRSDKGIEFSSL